MASIAEYSLDATAFPLGAVFETHPSVTLELDRVVPTGDTVMPYFWVHDEEGDLEDVRAVFADLSALRSAELVSVVDHRGLFCAEWRPDFMGIMRAIAEAGVTVLSATGSRGGWRFEVRGDDADALSAFQAACDEYDVDVTLTRLSHMSRASRTGPYGLTESQREALVLAYERGYYREPAAVSLADLADDVGITGQSFGARLRRGTGRLLEHTLVDDFDQE